MWVSIPTLTCKQRSLGCDEIEKGLLFMSLSNIERKPYMERRILLTGVGIKCRHIGDKKEIAKDVKRTEKINYDLDYISHSVSSMGSGLDEQYCRSIYPLIADCCWCCLNIQPHQKSSGSLLRRACLSLRGSYSVQ
jgi:hypothetical protein